MPDRPRCLTPMPRPRCLNRSDPDASQTPMPPMGAALDEDRPLGEEYRYEGAAEPCRGLGSVRSGFKSCRPDIISENVHCPFRRWALLLEIKQRLAAPDWFKFHRLLPGFFSESVVTACRNWFFCGSKCSWMTFRFVWL